MMTAALTGIRAAWLPVLCACLALAQATQAPCADTPEATAQQAQLSDPVLESVLEAKTASPDSTSSVDPSLLPSAEAGTPPSDRLSAAAASPIQYKQDDVVERTLGRLGWVLLLVAGLLGTVLYLQKRRTGKTGSRFDRRLKVVETLRLSSRNALYLVEMDHRAVLLGMNGSEMKVLATLTDLTASHPPLLNSDEDPQ